MKTQSNKVHVGGETSPEFSEFRRKSTATRLFLVNHGGEPQKMFGGTYRNFRNVFAYILIVFENLDENLRPLSQKKLAGIPVTTLVTAAFCHFPEFNGNALKPSCCQNNSTSRDSPYRWKRSRGADGKCYQICHGCHSNSGTGTGHDLLNCLDN